MLRCWGGWLVGGWVGGGAWGCLALQTPHARNEQMASVAGLNGATGGRSHRTSSDPAPNSAAISSANVGSATAPAPPAAPPPPPPPLPRSRFSSPPPPPPPPPLPALAADAIDTLRFTPDMVAVGLGRKEDGKRRGGEQVREWSNSRCSWCSAGAAGAAAGPRLGSSRGGNAQIKTRCGKRVNGLCTQTPQVLHTPRVFVCRPPLVHIIGICCCCATSVVQHGYAARPTPLSLLFLPSRIHCGRQPSATHKPGYPAYHSLHLMAVQRVSGSRSLSPAANTNWRAWYPQCHSQRPK